MLVSTRDHLLALTQIWMALILLIFKEQSEEAPELTTLCCSSAAFSTFVWDNLPWREELLDSKLCTTWHTHVLFPPQTGCTCFFLLWKLTHLRWVSLPPTVVLCHLRPAAATHPPSFSIPSTFKDAVWLLNVFSLKDTPHLSLSLILCFSPGPAGVKLRGSAKQWTPRLLQMFKMRSVKRTCNISPLIKDLCQH